LLFALASAFLSCAFACFAAASPQHTPRMAVRSAMPWPLRWVLLALVFGFCAAVALWAFETGKNIAGLDRHSREELAACACNWPRRRKSATRPSRWPTPRAAC
jgi:hypothetical protein